MIKEILKKYPCDDDCRFDMGHSTRTLIGYKPLYDKEGVNLNPDRNITTTKVYCTVCKKMYIVKEQLGEYTVNLAE